MWYHKILFDIISVDTLLMVDVFIANNNLQLWSRVIIIPLRLLEFHFYFKDCLISKDQFLLLSSYIKMCNLKYLIVSMDDSWWMLKLHVIGNFFYNLCDKKLDMIFISIIFIVIMHFEKLRISKTITSLDDIYIFKRVKYQKKAIMS